MWYLLIMWYQFLIMNIMWYQYNINTLYQVTVIQEFSYNLSRKRRLKWWKFIFWQIFTLQTDYCVEMWIKTIKNCSAKLQLMNHGRITWCWVLKQLISVNCFTPICSIISYHIRPHDHETLIQVHMISAVYHVIFIMNHVITACFALSLYAAWYCSLSRIISCNNSYFISK